MIVPTRDIDMEMIKMLGIFKLVSPVGLFIKRHKITQEELAKLSGVNRNTINKVCTMKSYNPRKDNKTKIIKALRKFDPNISQYDFWE